MLGPLRLRGVLYWHLPPLLAKSDPPASKRDICKRRKRELHSESLAPVFCHNGQRAFASSAALWWHGSRIWTFMSGDVLRESFPLAHSIYNTLTQLLTSTDIGDHLNDISCTQKQLWHTTTVFCNSSSIKQTRRLSFEFFWMISAELREKSTQSQTIIWSCHIHSWRDRALGGGRWKVKYLI